MEGFRKGLFWCPSSQAFGRTAQPKLSSKPPLLFTWQATREWIPDDDRDLNWFNQERDPTGAEPTCFD